MSSTTTSIMENKNEPIDAIGSSQSALQTSTTAAPSSELVDGNITPLASPKGRRIFSSNDDEDNEEDVRTTSSVNSTNNKIVSTTTSPTHQQQQTIVTSPVTSPRTLPSSPAASSTTNPLSPKWNSSSPHGSTIHDDDAEVQLEEEQVIEPTNPFHLIKDCNEYPINERYHKDLRPFLERLEDQPNRLKSIDHETINMVLGDWTVLTMDPFSSSYQQVAPPRLFFHPSNTNTSPPNIHQQALIQNNPIIVANGEKLPQRFVSPRNVISTVNPVNLIGSSSSLRQGNNTSSVLSSNDLTYSEGDEEIDEDDLTSEELTRYKSNMSQRSTNSNREKQAKITSGSNLLGSVTSNGSNGDNFFAIPAMNLQTITNSSQVNTSDQFNSSIQRIPSSSSSGVPNPHKPSPRDLNRLTVSNASMANYNKFSDSVQSVAFGEYNSSIGVPRYLTQQNQSMTRASDASAADLLYSDGQNDEDDEEDDSTDSSSIMMVGEHVTDITDGIVSPNTKNMFDQMGKSTVIQLQGSYRHHTLTVAQPFMMRKKKKRHSGDGKKKDFSASFQGTNREIPFLDRSTIASFEDVRRNSVFGRIDSDDEEDPNKQNLALFLQVKLRMWRMKNQRNLLGLEASAQ